MQQFKLFALGALLLAGFVNNLSAQELGKIRYRVEAGPTLSKISNFALDHLNDSGKGLINFRAGVSFALPFVHTPFTLAPGIFFNGRGERQTGNRNNAPKPLAKLQTYAVQVPVDFSFRIITVEENQHVFLNVTPYASYLLSAKITRGGSPIIDVAGDLRSSKQGFRLALCIATAASTCVLVSNSAYSISSLVRVEMGSSVEILVLRATYQAS